MKKAILLWMIVCFIAVSTEGFARTEGQKFREELAEQRSEMPVSYEKYREFLEERFDSKPASRRNSSWGDSLKYLPMILGILALSAAVIFFIRQIRMNLITEAHEAVPDSELANVETEKAALTRAETAVAASDFREALRFLYLSAVLNLQERGLLPYDRSLTNREYLRHAQTNLNLQDKLRPIITVFDEVWYGHKPCDAKTVADYRALLQKVYAAEG